MFNRYLTAFGQKKLSVWLHGAAIGLIALVVFRDALQTDNLSVQQAHIRTFTQTEGAQNDLVDFYVNRHFALAWHDNENRRTLLANSILYLLEKASDEGLDPADYITPNIKAILSLTNSDDHKRIANADFEITKSTLRYISHMRGGKLRIAEIESVWPYVQKTSEDATFLERGLATGELLERIIGLAPKHRQYQLLKTALRELREQSTARSKWTRIPDLGILKFNQSHPKTVLLRQRLVQSGDLAVNSNSTVFDDELKQAVTRYQYRNGLPATGVPGSQTVASFNVSVERRIQQIIVNMERWRHVPLNVEPRHVLVNAAGFELIAFKNGFPELTMRVIIGEKALPTPIFSARLDRVILNPEWHVPRTIAVNEMLPKIISDASYITQNNLYVTRSGSDQPGEVDIGEISWRQLGEANFPYEIHQRAGKQNPLGKYKFSIPNEHQVYLHDTPHKVLFKNNERDMSHGCVRLENSGKLANFILSNDSYWTPSKIAQSVTTGEQLVITLRETVPVDIVYFTAWVDESGLTNFYPDIYALDEPIEKALFKPR